MNTYITGFFLHSQVHLRSVAAVFIFMILGGGTTLVIAQTYTTIASGNFSAPATWAGGIVPPVVAQGGMINAGQTIVINHSVTYNLSNNISNNGTMRIETLSPAPALPAGLRVPSGINVTNNATGRFVVNYGKYVQCRFDNCTDSSPNPQAGTLVNIGGQMTVSYSVIEVGQDWVNESGGRRVVQNSCIKTGQNFSLSGSTTFDELQDTSVSVGWHGSGNIQHSDGTVHNVSGMRYQIAGTSGAFQYNSGTAYGAIQFITLRNHVTNVNGGGLIEASSSLNISTGLVLSAYWVDPASNYIPNGKFSGSQTLVNNTNLFFPDSSCDIASNPFPQPPLNCSTLYGSYASSPATTFTIASISTSSATRTNYLSTPVPLTDSRGNGAALTPDGRYYFYRSNTSNRLTVYDSLNHVVIDTGQNMSGGHIRMDIDPTGTYGYASSAGIFQRFLVNSPYTLTNLSIVSMGAPAGLEYEARIGGDLAFDGLGYAYSVAERGGPTNPLDAFFYRLEASPSSPVVTASFLGQITSSNAAFSTFDTNGTAFLNGTLYIGGAATALGNDAQLWRLDTSTGQASLVGTDSAGSNDTQITDMASCQYPNFLLPANLSVSKSNGTDTLVAGQSTTYTVTFSNAGPYPVYGAIVRDSASVGLSACSVASCTVSGNAQCPVSFSNFVAPAAGVSVPILGQGSNVSLQVTCNVSATGL